MILDSTTKSVKVIVDAAATAHESDITADYVDYTDAVTLPGSSDGVTTGLTAAVAVAAPTTGVQRHVKFMSINNADSVSHTYTVVYVNAAATRRIVVMTLVPGQSAQYTDSTGWQFVRQENPAHQSVSATITAENTFTAALLVKANDVVSVSVGGAGWTGTVSLQRMLDGATWNTVVLPAGLLGWTAPVEMSYLVDETGYLRLGVITGNYGTGSILGRLGVN